MTEIYCDACDGDGWVTEIWGYTQTGPGFGDCHENERVVECEECCGHGYIEEDEEE